MSSAVAEKPGTSLTRVDKSTEDHDLTASSGWQDDLCMEPITPVPGFSKLCNACIKVFREKTRVWGSGIIRLKLRHIRCSEVLKISAQRGCRLCALLFTDIQRRASCLQVTMTSVIGLHFSQNVGELRSTLLFSGIGLRSWHFRLSMYPVEGIGRPWTRIRPISARDNLMSNQSLAKKWFLSCTTTHSRCRPRPCDTNFPTRLLEIDGSGEHTSVRIITTDKNPRVGEYMTLSHCWGAAQFITLRKDNLAELGQGIQLEKLPKTFQDAVAVAQWFEVRYLWIDSLCILQDSQEDWAKESATMRSVYSCSIMNISATGAVDPSIGCFLDRKFDSIRPFSALLSGSEIDYICFEAKFWQANISDAPLSKRAWAFQERLLSPRILHFGASQMAWECMESVSCETFPEGILEPTEQTHSVITKRALFDRTRGFSIGLWKALITYYTSCAMTVPSDIYMAFAGVVEEIHSLTADEYFAGFWRKDLELQLLWERKYSATWKPTGYRAPSWSWFSANGAIDFPWLLTSYRREVVYKVLNVFVQYSAECLYGPVTYGCLRCRGILGTAVRKTRDQHWVILAVDGQRLEIKSTPRWDHKTDLSKHEVTYLPVLNLIYRSFVLALLLEPTHVKEGEYQRIGTWRVEGEDNCRNMLCEQMPGNGAWVDRPEQIFTIV